MLAKALGFSRILIQRFVLHAGHQTVPDEVENVPDLRRARGNGDDGVLLGHDEGELAAGAGGPIGPVAVTPELVSVSLVPGAVGIAAVGGLPAGGLLHPLGGQQLFALPLAPLQIQLPEAGDRLRRDAQPESAVRDALGIGAPGRLHDAQRVQQPRAQIVQQVLPGDRVHNRRQHVRGGRVVVEVRARLVGHGEIQKDLRQRRGGIERKRAQILPDMAGRHGQQIADAHGLKLPGRFLGHGIGEERDDLVMNIQMSLIDCKADAGRGETLAQGEQRVDEFGAVGRPPALGHDVTVAQDHQAVHVLDPGVERLDEVGDRSGRNALLLRRTAG